MTSVSPITVVMATGGTIAGRARRVDDHLGYSAGSLDAQALVDAVPPLAEVAIETVELAAIDSADIDHVTWQALWRAVTAQLARPEVGGIVITHGTDTLEETACWLDRSVVANKPVVLTAAMRPASALSADGPQNLLDAVTLAREPGAGGVVVVLGGRVWAGSDIRKVHGYRVDAFGGGDAGPVAAVQAGRVRRFRAWPTGAAALPAGLAAALQTEVGAWPRVDIVSSHGGADARVLTACIAAGAAGVVIAGTGNATIHRTLLQAARQAQRAGVVVVRATRCTLGGVMADPQDADALPSYGALTPAQARVALLLDLLLRQQQPAGSAAAAIRPPSA